MRFIWILSYVGGLWKIKQENVEIDGENQDVFMFLPWLNDAIFDSDDLKADALIDLSIINHKSASSTDENVLLAIYWTDNAFSVICPINGDASTKP